VPPELHGASKLTSKSEENSQTLLGFLVLFEIAARLYPLRHDSLNRSVGAACRPRILFQLCHVSLLPGLMPLDPARLNPLRCDSFNSRLELHARVGHSFRSFMVNFRPSFVPLDPARLNPLKYDSFNFLLELHAP